MRAYQREYGEPVVEPEAVQQDPARVDTERHDQDGEDERPGSAKLSGKLDVVDLSYKRIADIPIEVVDELRDARAHRLARPVRRHIPARGVSHQTSHPITARTSR